MPKIANVDQDEIAKFDQVSSVWWDSKGEMRTLQTINPLRTTFITDRVDIRDARILDVGCGGGILAEALAELGARVTAIDLSEASLEVARKHAAGRGLELAYRNESVEAIAGREPQGFDVLTCMEMLEHVPDPAGIVSACSQALKPGGHAFFSTIDRTPKAFLFAILGGEYVLRLLPRGSHTYGRLIRPAELAHWAVEAGLKFAGFSSLIYNPFSGKFKLAEGRADVNYMAHFFKP